MNELTIQLDSRDEALGLFGSRDRYLKEIRDTLGVQLVGRGDAVLVKGTDEQLDQVQRVFTQLRQMLRHHGHLTAESVRTVLEVVQQGGDRLDARRRPRREISRKRLVAVTSVRAPMDRDATSAPCAKTT